MSGRENRESPLQRQWNGQQSFKGFDEDAHCSSLVILLISPFCIVISFLSCYSLLLSNLPSSVPFLCLLWPYRGSTELDITSGARRAACGRLARERAGRGLQVRGGAQELVHVRLGMLAGHNRLRPARSGPSESRGRKRESPARRAGMCGPNDACCKNNGRGRTCRRVSSMHTQSDHPASTRLGAAPAHMYLGGDSRTRRTPGRTRKDPFHLWSCL